ncbi:MAG TPA: helix-turn-helix transcriptional regulator, partial [Allosphingosinicella sp.]|nr:helix-turn-helix transcriptional regulator [Allosphingosinicella sp.]
MPRKPNSSPQTRRVLAALAARPEAWRHGLSLCGETDLSSGTLYPLLSRLKRHGYLESEWREPETPGRPPRHVYRLTAGGRALAAAGRESAAPS